MTLVLGQRWLTSSAMAMLLAAPSKAKSFDARRDVNSLTFLAACADGVWTCDRQSSWTVIPVIATGSSGRSRLFRGADTIASTMSIPFVTWPKSV